MQCPIDELEMFYHEPSNTHACQNPECIYAKGVSMWEMDASFLVLEITSEANDL